MTRLIIHSLSTCRRRRSLLLRHVQLIIIILLLSCKKLVSHGFIIPKRNRATLRHVLTERSIPLRNAVLFIGRDDRETDATSTNRYEDSDAASKGLVGSLTAFVNTATSLVKGVLSPTTSSSSSTTTANSESTNQSPLSAPPSSPKELLERIRDDYVKRNYLWTGQIDLASFDVGCRFTDPTLSFTGRDKFVKNTGNLVPIVEALTTLSSSLPSSSSPTSTVDDAPPPRSELLEITLNQEQGYVQTRWNMVGDLVGLPWKPRIDVVGRTKFWYQAVQASSPPSAISGDYKDDGNAKLAKDEENLCYQVTFYDEEWEMPAAKALLQLVTPPGTIKMKN